MLDREERERRVKAVTDVEFGEGCYVRLLEAVCGREFDEVPSDPEGFGELCEAVADAMEDPLWPDRAAVTEALEAALETVYGPGLATDPAPEPDQDAQEAPEPAAEAEGAGDGAH